jgi:hypothetical protein
MSINGARAEKSIQEFDAGRSAEQIYAHHEFGECHFEQRFLAHAPYTQEVDYYRVTDSGNLLGISFYLAGSKVYIEGSDNDAAYNKSVSV